MGCYVNPENESKEDFLRREGRQIPDATFAKITEEEKPVCLIYNDTYTAAAVAYNVHKLAALAEVDEPRPKVWYMVPTAKLIEVSDLENFL